MYMHIYKLYPSTTQTVGPRVEECVLIVVFHAVSRLVDDYSVIQHALWLRIAIVEAINIDAIIIIIIIVMVIIIISIINVTIAIHI